MILFLFLFLCYQPDDTKRGTSAHACKENLEQEEENLVWASNEEAAEQRQRGMCGETAPWAAEHSRATPRAPLCQA